MQTYYQFYWNKIDEESIRILRIFGESEDVIVPETIGGRAVMEAGDYCFAASKHLPSEYECTVCIYDTEEKKWQEIPADGADWNTRLVELSGDRLKKVTLPDNMHKVGNYAFYNCTALEMLETGKYLEEIGSDAFMNCKKFHFLTVRCDVGERSGANQILSRISADMEVTFQGKTGQTAKGTTKTLQEGENGLRRVTMQNVYDTNGVLLEQTILSTETIREPVNKKVVVGTKKVTKNGAAAYIGGSGQFIWPVPGYRNCSRWYGSGHKGVDICASAGTPIYASAGGTVTKAGYNKAGAGTGYGYSVIISHSGGYTTVYAHCLSLAVSAGQTVRQGQLIGYVGSTGRSSGNHCHFEIRRNGSYIAPQSVFSGKR